MDELTFESLDETLSGLGDHCPFLISLRDGPDNDLHIFIAPSVTRETMTDLPEIAAEEGKTGRAVRELLSRCRPIEPDGKRLYEICFEDYIIYEVRNESYAAWDGTENRHGRWLFTLDESNLLDNVEKATNAARFSDGNFFPGPWRHYGVFTQNHVIDVISHVPPVVREVKES